MIEQTFRGTVYGVILNDAVSLARIGALDEAPYKGAPKAPVLYVKPAGTRVATGAVVSLPAGATSVEVGATVGLVMGRDAARLSPSSALDAVCGLVLAADLSLPHASYYRPAIREKCFDGALPLGALAPVRAVDALCLRTEIDGEVVEERPMSELLRSPARLLADVTEFMTLRTGDVLLLGVRYQSPRAEAGSHIRLSAEGLGSLAFSIAKQGAQS